MRLVQLYTDRDLAECPHILDPDFGCWWTCGSSFKGYPKFIDSPWSLLLCSYDYSIKEPYIVADGSLRYALIPVGLSVMDIT